MTETRYVVRGKVEKNVAGLSVKAGTDVWLTYSRESGGWHSWSQDFRDAKAFPTQEGAAAESNCNGPWYLVPDPNSIEILEADYEPARAAKITLRGLGQ